MGHNEIFNLSMCEFPEGYFPKDRLREFIKRLKENITLRCNEIKLWEADAINRIMHEEIDKLAGEKLI